LSTAGRCSGSVRTNIRMDAVNGHVVVVEEWTELDFNVARVSAFGQRFIGSQTVILGARFRPLRPSDLTQVAAFSLIVLEHFEDFRTNVAVRIVSPYEKTTMAGITRRKKSAMFGAEPGFQFREPGHSVGHAPCADT